MSKSFFVKESKSFDLSVLRENPKLIDFNEFNSNYSGRVDFKFNDVTLECFIKTSKVKRLFVFFSAAGRSNSQTQFNRVSWCSKLDANMVFIEDPMYKKYKGLRCGWFYGDNEVNYLKNICSLIEKIAKIELVDFKDIVFVGASAAGYAALYCADELKGSLAYAYNPQIILSKWPDAKQFQEITGIDLSINDKFQRSNIKRIEKNRVSNFVIYYNPASKHDNVQIGSWMKELGISTTNGYSSSGNIHFFSQEVKNHNPHSCVADINDFVFAVSMFDENDFDKKDCINSNLDRFNSYALKDEESFYSKLWYEVVVDDFPKVLESPRSIAGCFLDTKIKYFGDIFKYRLSHMRSNKDSEIVIYIKKDEIVFSEEFYGVIEKITKDHDFQLIKSERDNFLRVSKKFKGSKDLRKNLVDVILKFHFPANIEYAKRKFKSLNNKDRFKFLINLCKFIYCFKSWEMALRADP